MHCRHAFQTLGEKGKPGFYSGDIAECIVNAVHSAGGVMSLDDLASHTSTFEEPISVEYKGTRLWETAPSSHGIVALMTLNILKHFDLQSMYVIKFQLSYRSVAIFNARCQLFCAAGALSSSNMTM